MAEKSPVRGRIVRLDRQGVPGGEKERSKIVTLENRGGNRFVIDLARGTMRYEQGRNHWSPERDIDTQRLIQLHGMSQGHWGRLSRLFSEGNIVATGESNSLELILNGSTGGIKKGKTVPEIIDDIDAQTTR